MWKGVSGNTPFIWNLSANVHINCTATIDIFDTNWSTHDTFFWLSQNTATWSQDFASHTSSITSHSNKSLEMSKSKFVNVPVRLELEVIYIFTHSGHCMRNNVGVHGNLSPKTTSPTLWPDTSLTPMYSGHTLISSLQVVGLRLDSSSSVFISLI